MSGKKNANNDGPNNHRQLEHLSNSICNKLADVWTIYSTRQSRDLKMCVDEAVALSREYEMLVGDYSEMLGYWSDEDDVCVCIVMSSSAIQLLLCLLVREYVDTQTLTTLATALQPRDNITHTSYSQYIEIFASTWHTLAILFHQFVDDICDDNSMKLLFACVFKKLVKQAVMFPLLIGSEESAHDFIRAVHSTCMEKYKHTLMKIINIKTVLMYDMKEYATLINNSKRKRSSVEKDWKKSASVVPRIEEILKMLGERINLNMREKQERINQLIHLHETCGISKQAITDILQVDPDNTPSQDREDDVIANLQKKLKILHDSLVYASSRQEVSDGPQRVHALVSRMDVNTDHILGMYTPRVALPLPLPQVMPPAETNTSSGGVITVSDQTGARHNDWQEEEEESVVMLSGGRLCTHHVSECRGSTAAIANEDTGPPVTSSIGTAGTTPVIHVNNIVVSSPHAPVESVRRASCSRRLVEYSYSDEDNSTTTTPQRTATPPRRVCNTAAGPSTPTAAAADCYEFTNDSTDTASLIAINSKLQHRLNSSWLAPTSPRPKARRRIAVIESSSDSDSGHTEETLQQVENRLFYVKTKRRQRWNDEEAYKLFKAVLRHGKDWSYIKTLYDFRSRTNVQLKDKWRNMEQSDQHRQFLKIWQRSHNK